jgi:hypothetical protein
MTVIASYPRSGSTYLRYLLTYAINPDVEKSRMGYIHALLSNIEKVNFDNLKNNDPHFFRSGETG